MKVYDQYIKCLHKDQVVEFKINSNVQNKNLSVYFGNLVCPSCHEICKNQIICPTEQFITPDVGRPEKFSNFFFSYNLLRSNKETNFLNEQHNECLRIAFNKASNNFINPFYTFLIIFNLILSRIN